MADTKQDPIQELLEDIAGIADEHIMDGDPAELLFAYRESAQDALTSLSATKADLRVVLGSLQREYLTPEVNAAYLALCAWAGEDQS